MTAWSKRSRKILYLCVYEPGGISTVVEQVQDWEALSSFEVLPVNLYHSSKELGMRLPDPALLDGVDVVFLHPTTAYFPHNLERLCEDIRRHANARDPVLVLYKQDEHVGSHQTARIIGQYGIDLVLTCVAPEMRERVYPRHLVGDAIFEEVYTGYVSERLLRTAPRPTWESREIDFLYRGSKQPPSIGRLGFLKYALARRLKLRCAKLGLTADASAEWEDRILGFEWIRRLSKARATVSLESGSECFDFDGTLEERTREFLEQHPGLDPWSDSGYAELHDAVLAQFEGNIHYGQIAPRHFEAAVTQTVQLMLPGDYSGIFIKDRHYLELAPDLENLGEQWERLQDPEVRNALRECAYEEIVLRPELGYRALVQRIDELLEGILSRLGAPSQRTEAKWAGRNVERHIEKDGRPLIVVACPHEAHLDPRIEWWRAYTFPDARVEVIETSPQVRLPGGVSGGANVLISARCCDGMGLDDLPAHVLESPRGHVAAAALSHAEHLACWLDRYSDLEKRHTPMHQYLLHHMVRNSVGLLEAFGRLRGVDGLVVADLPALPAGIIAAELFDIPLLYDAQEIWGHATQGLLPEEVEWWTALEKRLLTHVDLPVTVSPGLAEWYQIETGTHMYVVPNFPPRVVDDALPIRLCDEPVRFIFLGNFAPGRGLEELIQAWDLDPAVATLTLQGPDSPHRKVCISLTRKTGRLGCGIDFPDAVPEPALIETARQFDIGIIPYTYGYPYNHCSPNKLGQYLAAGCAVLANRLPFVEACLQTADCGATVNFNSPEALRECLHRLAGDRAVVQRWRTNARKAAGERYNWEISVAATASMFLELLHLQHPEAAVLTAPGKHEARDHAATSMIATGFHQQAYLKLIGAVKSILRSDSLTYRFARSVHRRIYRHLGF
jgi:glycosyltransferase involved in cell wall biosynthesis